jgi:carbamoyl-phosphate synthase large subunit
MNVLITSAARKVWLVDAFRRAVTPLGGQVWAADTDPLAVTLRVADGRLVLPLQDAPEFEVTLLGACEAHKIRLIVPTRDAELDWFAARKVRFAQAGVTVLVAASETIQLCQDKRAFVQHCESNGFAVPSSMSTPADNLIYPLFARPRTGAGGRGAGRVDDVAALARLTPWDDWLVQELIDLPEYTLDLFADLSGRVLSVVPRRRLRVIAGESVVAVTVSEPALIDRAVALANSLGLVGHNTLQCFFDCSDPLWIEINPRYGGGAALGFAAGVDTPAMLVRLLTGERVPPRLGDYETDLYLYRYSADLFVKGAA